MKVFVSWSGGKDCMLALYRTITQKEHTVAFLLNMVDDQTDMSRSHGLKKESIARQAACMQIPILQPQANWNNYEDSFKATLRALKQNGVDGGVFGDIYLEEHRTWIERVCKECDMQAIFPLWLNDTSDLLKEFISAGFETLTVAVNKQQLTKEWLGRKIDLNFLHEITAMPDIDPCAENGEYHSFVFNGPLFKQPLSLSIIREYEDEKHWFLELK